MSVELESKNRIANLISAANAKTGNEDTDLTSAVGSLIAGFGQGGSAMYAGTITLADKDMSDLVFDAPGATFFCIQIQSEPAYDLNTAFFVSVAANKDVTSCTGSNNAGTSVSSGDIHSTGNTSGYYPGVAFTDTGVTLIAGGVGSSASNSKWLQAGATYEWFAW